MKKNRAFALLSIMIAATIFGVLVFSTSASEDVILSEEETAPIVCGFRNRWIDTLNEDQLAILKGMIEENKAEVQNQIETWGVEIFELDDEQREFLKTIINENRDEVQNQLKTWGIEIPVRRDPMGLRDSLTDEQKDELQTMRQNFQDAVNAKLEEWGEVPDFDGPNGFGKRFRRRGARCFSLFKP